jgi:hypothetical protein
VPLINENDLLWIDLCGERHPPGGPQPFVLNGYGVFCKKNKWKARGRYLQRLLLRFRTDPPSLRH